MNIEPQDHQLWLIDSFKEKFRGAVSSVENMQQALSDIMHPPEEGGSPDEQPKGPRPKYAPRATHWLEGPFLANRESNRAKVFGTRTIKRDESLHEAYKTFLRAAKQRDLDKLPKLPPSYTGGLLHQHLSPPTWLERKNAG